MSGLCRSGTRIYQGCLSCALEHRGDAFFSSSPQHRFKKYQVVLRLRSLFIMRFPPPEVRAHWPKPNYTDPVTRGPGLMIVELTLVPIALTCVLLRLWIRIGWLHKSWWDDWLMVAAMVSCALSGKGRLLTGTRSSPVLQRPWS